MAALLREVTAFFGSDASGNEDGWVEVMFFNSANVLIADYKSAIMDPTFVRDPSLPTVTNALGNVYLGWIHCQVTNQYDPTTVTPNSDPSTTSPAGPTTYEGHGHAGARAKHHCAGRSSQRGIPHKSLSSCL